MTTKTIKTILFVGLIAAMILPFSVMDISAASDNTAKEKSDADRAKMVELGYELTNSLAIRNDARDSMLAQGYELYPGAGWVLPPDQKVEPIYTTHPKTGEKVLDGDAMMAKLAELTEEEMTVSSLTSTTGWNQVALKDDPTNDFTYLRAQWTVPTSPISYEGGTNFSFPAIQPDLSIGTFIFQPVLQHGFSAICDAENGWVTYALILVGEIPFNTPCVPVNEGDVNKGSIIYEDGIWTVAMGEAEYLVASTTTMTFGAVAVETWDLGTDCDQLQGDLTFTNIRDRGDVDRFDKTQGHDPFCGQTTNVVSRTTVEMFNDN